ncbi:MAG: hypothetical protein R2827_11445 [Bdellovibrionales bacterium]
MNTKKQHHFFSPLTGLALLLPLLFAFANCSTGKTKDTPSERVQLSPRSAYFLKRAEALANAKKRDQLETIKVVLLPNVFLASEGKNRITRSQKNAYAHVDAILKWPYLAKMGPVHDSLKSNPWIHVINSETLSKMFQTFDDDQKVKYSTYTHQFREAMKTHENWPAVFYTVDFPLTKKFVQGIHTQFGIDADILIYSRYWLDWDADVETGPGRPKIVLEVFAIPAYETLIKDEPIRENTLIKQVKFFIDKPDQVDSALQEMAAEVEKHILKMNNQIYSRASLGPDFFKKAPPPGKPNPALTTAPTSDK